MPDLTFGEQLRKFRLQCHYSQTGKPVTQQQLGIFLKEEIGISYSGAAISDWERGKAKPGINDRLVLTSLIKILKQYGGIKTMADANLLLEAGNYRTLNLSEREKIFPEEIQGDHEYQTPTQKESSPSLIFLLNNIFFNSPVEFQKILDEAQEGPPTFWPRVAVSIINHMTNQWTVLHILKLLIWVWIWLITYLLISPSLQQPFTSQENALQIMALYAVGSIILPLFIGIMVNTKDQDFWKEQKISNTLTTRLYVHQGAYVGFHVGYFLLFPFAMIQNQFDIQPIIWVEFMKMIIPMAVGYAGAQLVPHNLWLTYKHLHLKDGSIFFVFIILGPVWAWFFLEFNKSIGILTILMAMTLLTSAMAIQYRRNGNTIIPVLWVIIFYSLIFLCQILSPLIQ